MTLLLLALLLLAVLLFVGCAPQLGAAGDGERITNSSHYHNGKFRNPAVTSVSPPVSKMFGVAAEYINGKQVREPESSLPTMRLDGDTIGNTSDLRVTWLGHSTCLIEIGGQVILTDPMFSERASPLSFLGPKRFASKMPIQPEEFPHLAAVLISHDHYDHLDYRSILALKNKTERFYVPLGVGGHLRRWGVAPEKIVELDWWEQASQAGLTFIAAPARHFSGRSFGRDQTLWASWVIMGSQCRVFFGGDSGYFQGFKQIGEKYGPFDLTMLESGAYNQAWLDVHMMPEQAVQAHIDLRGKVLLPIHWGKFNLSLHSWTEPVTRLSAEAKLKDVEIITPLQGQQVFPSKRQKFLPWWDNSFNGSKDVAEIIADSL